MEDFLQDKPAHTKATAVLFHGYRRVFLLVLGIALLWQAVSFLQLQLSRYHQELAQDFKIVMTAMVPLDNAALTGITESVEALPEVTSIKLFSAQDGLAVIQQRNPRLAQDLVLLGREQMPVYFEVAVNQKALLNVQVLAQQLATQYPQLSVKYVKRQAEMVFYSGICLRAINTLAVLALVVFFIFMLLVEAHPLPGNSHVFSVALSGILAGLLSLAVLAVLLYPAGFLDENLFRFTSVERQAGLWAFCGLLGWTLGKWKRF